jgi:hypothetical protein
VLSPAEAWAAQQPLLKALLRNVLEVDSVIADFGAGTGRAAKWLNETGLVTAVAFDGSPDCHLVTRGAVSHLHLGHDVEDAPGGFDYGLLLGVLDSAVAEHVGPILRNAARLAKAVVLSWNKPDTDVRKMVATETQLIVDEVATSKLHAAVTGRSVFVLRPAGASGVAGRLAPARLGREPVPDYRDQGCEMEAGFVYGGADVAVHPGVSSAEACCGLCSDSTQCGYWSWAEEGAAQAQTCWLKTSREHRLQQDGFVSGRKK